MSLHLNRTFTIMLVTCSSLACCRCADPPLVVGSNASAGSASGDSSAAHDDTGGSTGSEAEPSGSTGEPIDVSRFMGVFHYEFELMPFGREVPVAGNPLLVNLEILADGTASMTMEDCGVLSGPTAMAWRWHALPGPALEFTPGPGEESLRFMARSDLESVRATLVDGCDLDFEVDGQPIWASVYRPGRACWVNRCMPAWTVHLDYCDGEAPPPCE